MNEMVVEVDNEYILYGDNIRGNVTYNCVLDIVDILIASPHLSEMFTVVTFDQETVCS